MSNVFAAGDNATENFDNFLGWAFNCRQWQANTRNEAVKLELEQAKAELIDEMKAEHKVLQDTFDITDQQLERLVYLDNRLDNVHKELNYARTSRLRMANTLKHQRSYWRSYEAALPASRSSLDYWSAFFNQYELVNDDDCHDNLLSEMYGDYYGPSNNL